MTDTEPDWDTVMEQEAESRRDAQAAEYQPVDGEPGTCPGCGEPIRWDAEGSTWIHESGWICNPPY